MAFLNWVAYVKELSPDVQKDHLKCPMSNCRRDGFHDMMSFLSHVSTCDRLSEADYWCPYCCRQEHFGVSELELGSFTTGQPSKESKMKKACDFFKRFGRIGRRSPIFEDASYPSNGTRRELEVTTSYPIKHILYTIDEKPEMEVDIIFSRPKELDGTSPGTRNKRTHSLTSPSRSRKSSLHTLTHELRVSTQTLGPFEMSTSDPDYDRVELPSPDRYRLSIDCSQLNGLIVSHPAAPVPSESVPQDASLISPISPAFTQPAGQISPTSVSPITLPVYKVNSPSHACQVGICAAIPELDSVHAAEIDALNFRPRAICWRGFSSLRVENSNKIAAQARVNMYEQGASSTLAYVEALRQLLYVLKDFWQGHLKDWPDLCCRPAGLEVGSSLDDGLRGLKECLSGRLPTTLRDVLSLIYLGYTCAYMCHSDDASYAWDVFYQNVLQWGDAIADQQDRCRFFRIAELLWSIPQASHQPTAIMLLAEPLWQEGTKRPRSAITSLLKICHYNALVPRQHYAEPINCPIPASKLQALLVSGPVIECCSRVLDGKPFVRFSNLGVPYAGTVRFSRADHSGAILTSPEWSSPASFSRVLYLSNASTLLLWFTTGFHSFSSRCNVPSRSPWKMCALLLASA